MEKPFSLGFVLLAICLSACSPLSSGDDIYTGPPERDLSTRPTPTSLPTNQAAATSTPVQVLGISADLTPTFTTGRIFVMGLDDEIEGFASSDAVQATILGAGLEKIEISLESSLDVELLLAIIPGTLFEPISSAVQTMVAIEHREVILEPYAKLSLELDVACAEMRLDAPGSGDILAAKAPTNPELSRLVGLEGFIEEESFRVQQFAVWVITDNPSRGNFVRLGSLGVGSGPTQEEISRIRQLFEDAGISTEEYWAFN
jgi:hypothetical protein